MQAVSIESGPTLIHETFTIVIPAYNEEERIGVTLENICEFIKKNELSWKVVVSIDGNDKTHEIVSGYSINYPFVTGLKSSMRGGKAGALKRAFKDLDSKYLMTMDADGSIEFNDIIENLEGLRDSDVLIFSRYSKENKIPAVRRFLSRGYNALVKAIMGLKITDTQSGYIVALTMPFTDAMNKVGVTNEFYCIILYYYLEKARAKIKEIPVKYKHSDGSRFNITAMVIGGAISLTAFKIRHSRFYKYVPKNLISLYYRKFRWIQIAYSIFFNLCWYTRDVFNKDDFEYFFDFNRHFNCPKE